MHLSLVQTLYREIGSSEFAQIPIHGPIRRCRRRSSLEARHDRCAFCTNTCFTILGSPFSLLPFHMHYSLVQALYRAIGISKFAQISIHVPLRRRKTRSSLDALPGRCALCTNSRFTFLGSPSPMLRLLMHLSLLQTLYRAIGSSEFAQISIHGSIRRCRRRSSLEVRPGWCAFLH